MLPSPSAAGRFIRVRPNLRLHIVTTGPQDGPPVILLHGFPEFWWTWRAQLRFLDTCGFRTIAPDLRGFNLSDKPETGYDPETMAGDVVGLLDALGYDRAVVVGSDYGGMIAYTLALLHPKRISKLVILNALHPAVWPSPKRSGRLGIQAIVAVTKIGHHLFTPLFDVANDVIGIGGGIKWLSNNRNAFGPAVRKAYKTAYKRGARTATRYVPEAAAWLRDHLPVDLKILHKTLILWPERDLSAPQWVTRSTQDTLPNAEIQIIPKAGHWIQEEQPDAVNDALAAFLSQEIPPFGDL